MKEYIIEFNNGQHTYVSGYGISDAYHEGISYEKEDKYIVDVRLR